MVSDARYAAAGVLMMAAGMASAQQTPQAPVRGLETFSLPAASPTPTPTPVGTIPVPAAPVIILPRPTPTPRPRETPRARPTPQATPTPRALPTPAAIAPRAPVVAPAPSPAPAPTPDAAPTPAPATVATPLPAPIESHDAGPPWLQIVAALAIAAGVGWLLLGGRRRPAPIDTIVEDSPAPPSPPVAPVAPVPPVPVPIDPSRPRARIATALRPIRAGLNLLSATVEGEVSVTNTGDAAAHGILVETRLLGAHAGLDAELAALYAQPPGRPAIPPFALAPGETRTARIVVAAPRDAIRAMTAAGRPMFVPIVAIHIRYDAGHDMEGQTAQAFAIGVEQADSPKLAPFWLDGPPRTHDAVAARPHALALER